MRRILRKMKPTLRQIYQKLSEPPAPNLRGDRDMEHSWIAANIPAGPGKALDFGAGTSWMGLVAARKGYEVLAIDVLPGNWFYSYPHLEFRKINLFDLDVHENSLDLIINCSTIEHVGLKGRYKISTEQPRGDIEAMNLLRVLLKLGKPMLLTIPVGIDTIYSKAHRVYGSEQLPNLLKGWEIIKEEFWIKNEQNRWIQAGKDVALNIKTARHYYGLGLFVLR